MGLGLEVLAALGTGLAVGLVSALAGIGGGILLVPFLYLVYAGSSESPSAQTVVAHATSLGVSFFTSLTGTLRYTRAGAVRWGPAFAFAGPGVVSAFVTARLLVRSGEALWVRAFFALFLLIAAADMARRARVHRDDAPLKEPHEHSWAWLVAFGLVAGVMASLLGIGGGLIAVPVLIYVGRLPVQSVAPTALAGVCLTTLSGGLSYLTAGTAPALSPYMAGYLDLRMAVPLAVGAAVTVPLGVRFNRKSNPPTLYLAFAALFATIGAYLLWNWFQHRA